MKKLCLLLLLALTACAETDPYKRLDPAPTGELTAEVAGAAFIQRWPRQFKCVQTVTLDFRVQTQTLIGYLVVQEPDRFRLQGMTEQGLKLFDIVFDGRQTHVLFSVEEFSAQIIQNISRDTRRVFLSNIDATGGVWGYKAGSGGEIDFIKAPDVRIRPEDTGTRVVFHALHGDMHARFAGAPPNVDWYDYQQSGRSLYRVDRYEWQNFGELFLPSVVVLREPGIQSDGPPYKLTLKITELTVRDKPWPEKMFLPPEKDD